MLERLVRERGLERFAFFLVVGEGHLLPDGSEQASGSVIDDHGRVFTFWTGWDAGQSAVTFTTWTPVDPLPHWDQIAEYRRARAAVGLDAPRGSSADPNGDAGRH